MARGSIGRGLKRARVRFLGRAVIVACALTALTGCSTPVASSLDEPEANRVMLALDRAHVAASKEVDAANEGKYRVLVGSDDAARALAALRAEELPRERSDRQDANKGALVPSPAAEQAALTDAKAADLERSLESIDGVLSARVHLNVPVPDALSMRALADGPRDKATASVLVAHRGTAPPIQEAAVQRLVAGGVPGLAPGDVAVVMVPRSPIAAHGAGTGSEGDDGLARLGPFAVARSSLRAMQATLGALFILVAALAAALVMVASRFARLKNEAETNAGGATQTTTPGARGALGR